MATATGRACPSSWRLDLPDRIVAMDRKPVPTGGATFGNPYRSLSRFAAGDGVSPLAAPRAVIAVVDQPPRPRPASA